jgi:(2S)-methylsuccinyl-CoA dehydrogenase
MCVVTEELSRGWIGAGSLGTRSEIAGELIVLGGTEEQKATGCPGSPAGEVLPTAVFTEPDTAPTSARSRPAPGRTERRMGDRRRQDLDHPRQPRSDLMTMLAAPPDAKGYAGLSMLLVPKPRGTDADPFPGLRHDRQRDRGARLSRHAEYALQFDGMRAPADALLGGEQGRASSS